MYELCIMWSSVHQRECVYYEHPTIGWHILGFL